MGETTLIINIVDMEILGYKTWTCEYCRSENNAHKIAAIQFPQYHHGYFCSTFCAIQTGIPVHILHSACIPLID